VREQRTIASPSRRRPRGVWRLGLATSIGLLLLSSATTPPPAQALAESAEPPDPAAALSALIAETGEIEMPTMSAAEYESAAESYGSLLERLEEIDGEELGPADSIDLELLEAHLETRLFEIESVRLHELVPVRYLSLFSTSGLFLRPCGASSRQIDRAIEELERLPGRLESGRANLKAPARVWTENALYTLYYAKLLLRDEVPELCTDSAQAKAKLIDAAAPALEALESFEAWMESELLPRSTRSPAWSPEQIDFYQFEHELLTDYGSREMLRIALDEESQLLAEMGELAARIHPSGDLETVWNLMKDEAPPWDEVEPMARRYVEMASDWLLGPGSHVVSIPDNFDYGASYGPTVAGRISGYYVLTPLEERLTDEQKASRIRSYNPYWTHVISYHEWLGHNVQRAHANAHVTRPMRRMFGGIYLSQAWSFYLEKLLEDEGYYEVLPHLEALKTRMARLQMRMWRVQRIVTKIRMALGEMSFDEAVDAYVDKIGMEPANAFIEVQRDSQSPSPPGREIIGERVILEMRDAYRRRMGEHYQLRHFHEALLRYGDLPLPTIQRLMLDD
jgi:uncharacterized protein (DUF885 family)